MKKRLLSAILSFCMLLTMAPTVASVSYTHLPLVGETVQLFLLLLAVQICLMQLQAELQAHRTIVCGGLRLAAGAYTCLLYTSLIVLFSSGSIGHQLSQ